MPPAKTTFVLKGINIDDIMSRYGFRSEYTEPTEEIHSMNIPNDVTELPELNVELEYCDSARSQKRGVISMVDYLGNPLPEHTDKYCFWCHHPFDTPPLGVPVKYVPSEAIKRYKSDNITRLAIEFIDDHRRRQLREEFEVSSLFTQNPDELSHTTLIVENGFYLTDGIVCSFECMKAFIEANRHDTLYSRSAMYMRRMVRQKFGDIQINAAGSYRLLKVYGGNLDISEFRQNFATLIYEDLHNPLYEHPVQKSIGWLHSQEVRF